VMLLFEFMELPMRLRMRLIIYPVLALNVRMVYSLLLFVQIQAAFTTVATSKIAASYPASDTVHLSISFGLM
jgi:hypothetical protein